MHYWVARFKEKVKIGVEPKVRGTVAIDETVIKINGKRFYQAALDLERNEVVWMRVYPARNYLTTRDFLKNVLKYCENKPRFLVDRGPWYNDVFRDLKLSYAHETFGERSKVEAVFSSYKQQGLLQQLQPSERSRRKETPHSGQREPYNWQTYSQ